MELVADFYWIDASTYSYLHNINIETQMSGLFKIDGEIIIYKLLRTEKINDG